MPRAKRQATKYPGVHRRVIHNHDGSKGITVYDVKIGNVWISTGKHTNIEDAQRERIRALSERNTSGGIVARQRTLRDFAESVWLGRQQARVQQGRLRSSTLRNYRRDLNGYLLPTFGDHRLQAITVEDVQRFADELSAAGKAPYTVIRIVNTLSSILSLATHYRHVSHNVVTSVEKPAAKRQREPVALTLAQVRRLVDAAETPDERNLILIAAFTGARQGELFGLRWQNVSLEPEGAETVLIVEQAYQGEVVDSPKTASGRRLIPLGPNAAEAFRSQHVESQRPNPLGLVLPSAEGNVQRQSNFTRRVWTPLRERAGLPEVHFHDLRHFFISRVRNAGLPPAVTEQLAGHSDERTHRGYTHAIPGTEAATRAALAAAFAESEDE